MPDRQGRNRNPHSDGRGRRLRLACVPSVGIPPRPAIRLPRTRAVRSGCRSAMRSEQTPAGPVRKSVRRRLRRRPFAVLVRRRIGGGPRTFRRRRISRRGAARGYRRNEFGSRIGRGGPRRRLAHGRSGIGRDPRARTFEPEPLVDEPATIPFPQHDSLGHTMSTVVINPFFDWRPTTRRSVRITRRSSTKRTSRV